MYLVSSYVMRADDDGERQHEGANKNIERLIADIELAYIQN
jgi:hypothetical protein